MNARSAGIRRRIRPALLIVPAAILLFFAAANAHLVYVAVTSQPACVPHLKEAGQDGGYRAARSVC